ncbi:hypothetical protein VaNZ11_014963, partial [Volvox africanus]
MKRYTGRALIAAAALATEAYNSLSPAGTIFLALFLVWGGLATRSSLAPPREGARANLVLWSFASAAACVALLLQLLLPLLPYGGNGPGSLLWAVLGLRDLWHCSAWELLTIFAPPLLCALMALAEAQDAYTACCWGATVSSSGGSHGVAMPDGRSSGAPAIATDASAPDHEVSTTGARPAFLSPQQAAEAEGSSSVAEPAPECSPAEGMGLMDHRTVSRVVHSSGSVVGTGGSGTGSAPAASPSGYSAAACMLILLAALLWPAVFNLPWLLLASLSMAMWALRLASSPSMDAPLLRLSQLYCGAALGALYVWQLRTPDAWPPSIAHGGRALGLYRFHDTAVEAHVYNLILQTLHAAALTSLYAALGFAAGSASESWRRRRSRHVSRGLATSPATAAAMAHVGRSPAKTALREPLLPPLQAILPACGASAAAFTRASPPAQAPIREGIAGAGSSGASSDRAAPLEARSLGEGQQQQHPLGSRYHHSHHQDNQNPSGGGHALVAHVAGWVVAAVEALTSHPSVAAVALAGLSMVEVSVLGGALLAVGMWALLAPGRYGRRMLLRVSPALTMLLLTWNTAVYVVTCLSASYPHLLPPVLHSLGLFMYVSPPPVVLPLTGQALAIVAMAGLARAACGANSPVSSISNRSSGGGGVCAGIGDNSARLTLLLGLYHILHVLVPSSWILLGSYKVDILHGVYLLAVMLYCGATAVRLIPHPRVGAILPDLRTIGDEGGILNVVDEDVEDGVTTSAAAAAITAGSSGNGVVRAAAPPPLPAAPPAHRLLRLYASMHLLALYAAMCGQLPGLGFLQPEAWADVLRLVGLWAPRRAANCLPLLGALVLATAHAVAGKVLTATAATGGVTRGSQLSAPARPLQQLQPQPPPITAPVAIQDWMLALGASLGSEASSVGNLLISVLLYVLVLYDMRIGLLGLGYLALGLPLLLMPPRRDQYVALLRLSDHRSGQQHASGQPQHLILSTWHSRALLSARIRWLAPAALALYCALDLGTSYATAMLAVYGPSSGQDTGAAGSSTGKIAEWWWRLVGLLYGGGAPAASGTPLVLTLARPSSLLLAMQLYRWAFAASAVRNWMRRNGCCPGASGNESEGERRLTALGESLVSSEGVSGGAATATLPQARRLAKQASAAWFVKRWIILNVDLFSGTLLFAAAMASP